MVNRNAGAKPVAFIYNPIWPILVWLWYCSSPSARQMWGIYNIQNFAYILCCGSCRSLCRRNVHLPLVCAAIGVRDLWPADHMDVPNWEPTPNTHAVTHTYYRSVPRHIYNTVFVYLPYSMRRHAFAPAAAPRALALVLSAMRRSISSADVAGALRRCSDVPFSAIAADDAGAERTMLGRPRASSTSAQHTATHAFTKFTCAPATARHSEITCIYIFINSHNSGE